MLAMMTPDELYELGLNDLPALVSHTLSLQERNLTLEQSAALNSRNSSIPPGSEGLKKPKPKSLRVISGKKSGGQPGHTGATLNRVNNPDFIEIHRLSLCPCGCGRDLSAEPVINYEDRQVFDLPPQRLIVTEHKMEIKRCPVSGRLVQAPAPAGVTAPVQYGKDFLAWLVYLSTWQLLPLNRIGQMSLDLFGQEVSDDIIIKATKALNHELIPFEEAVKLLLLAAPVVGADETGLRVLKTLYWCHAVVTPELTWLGVHKKRGMKALEFFGILGHYKGRLVHDCLDMYFTLACMHAVCNAHILRELVFVYEEMKQDWAKSLNDLLLEMNKARDEQMLVDTSFPEQRLLDWSKRYDDILIEGRKVNPPMIPAANTPKKRGRKKQSKAQNLLDRLEKRKESVLAFAYDFRISFTNNLSEQAFRMQKVKQKISGCFRTVEGAERFARCRSYIDTVRKQGHSILEELKAAMIGNPFIPQPPPSG